MVERERCMTGIELLHIAYNKYYQSFSVVKSDLSFSNFERSIININMNYKRIVTNDY